MRQWEAQGKWPDFMPRRKVVYFAYRGNMKEETNPPNSAGPAPVPGPAAADYEERRADLVAAVNRAMDADPLVDSLIGGNPRDLMYDNHRHHAEFISNVLRFSQFEMLDRVLPWVYNSYHAHGFSYDYFPRALGAWKDAVRALLSPRSQPPVLAVYDWMLARHRENITRAGEAAVLPAPGEARWAQTRAAWLAAALTGDSRAARSAAEAAVHGLEDMKAFYLEVLQPALREVGRLWQTGEVSVAQEHLATSIAGRTMAAFYVKFMDRKPTRGAAVITSAPDEYHEVGARMVADFLEIDGWDTAFLGANTPAAEVLALLKARKPAILGISVMMPFNLAKAEQLIAAVRAEPDLSGVKIMVGGGAVNLAPEIKARIRADGWAGDAAQAVQLAAGWSEAK